MPTGGAISPGLGLLAGGGDSGDGVSRSVGFEGFAPGFGVSDPPEPRTAPSPTVEAPVEPPVPLGGEDDCACASSTAAPRHIVLSAIKPETRMVSLLIGIRCRETHH